MKRILISILVAAVLLWAGDQASDAKAKAGKTAEELKAAAAEQARAARAKADDNAVAQQKQRLKEARERATAAAAKAEKTKAEKAKVEKELKAAEEKGGTAEKAGGKEHQQQLAALQKQLAGEEQKHLKRRVRLQRIRQLALETGKTDTVARVDKLLAKERDRFGKKNITMKSRLQKATQAAGAAKKPAVSKKAKGKADKMLKDVAE
ncbi:MAG: hypothetical protein JW720_16235 [Sedimentisphaerales bacterium]|nr:hypothetical protein [Sedimentisphaerales bacterium]